MVRTDQSAGKWFRCNGSDGRGKHLLGDLALAAKEGERAEAGGGGQGMMQGTMGKDYVVGEVKSVDAPKLTILRVDSVTQTLELNEDTSTAQGPRQHHDGRYSAGGSHFLHAAFRRMTFFVPKGVNVIPPEQWKRMQEMISEGGEKRGGTRQSTPAPSAPPAPAAPPPAQNPPEQRN